MSNDQEYVVEKVGVFTPKPNDIEELSSGEIGFIITGRVDVAWPQIPSSHGGAAGAERSSLSSKLDITNYGDFALRGGG